MLKLTINQGETLVQSYQLQLDGVDVDADETWEAALRICSGRVGGPTAMDAVITIEDGKIVATADTGELAAGNYYFDVRITPPGGTPAWHGGTLLTLAARNSPS